MKNIILYTLCLPFLLQSFAVDVPDTPPVDEPMTQDSLPFSPDEDAVELLRVIYVGSKLTPDPSQIMSSIEDMDEESREMLAVHCQLVAERLESKAAEEIETTRNEFELHDEIARQLRIMDSDPNQKRSPLQLAPNASVYLWAKEMEGVLRGDSQWKNTTSCQFVLKFFERLAGLDYAILLSADGDWQTKQQLVDLKEKEVKQYIIAVSRNSQDIIAPIFESYGSVR